MRQPRPWLRKQTGTWYVCIDGEQHSLGKDKAEAHDEFHRLMTERTGVVRTTRLTVREIVTAYLDYVKANRAANTHKKYKHILTTFSASTAATLRPHALRPYHVQQCIDKHYSDRSTTYQADVITSIVAALNWGESMGLVTRNPIARMKKPRRNVRENYVPSEKWAELIAAASDDCFRDYLTVALSSGARPNELRTMQAGYLNGSRVIFPRLKSKGKTRQRVVYLDPISLGIVQRLAKQYPTGPLFRNREGEPWNRHSIKDRFRRLQTKWPGLCATVLRHSFTHQKLTSGVDSLTVAKLLGHVDTRMIATRYGHLEEAEEYLLEKAATGNPLAKPANGQAASGKP